MSSTITSAGSATAAAAAKPATRLKLGTLCGRDGCQRKVEEYALDTASDPFKHVHLSLSSEAHNYTGPISQAQLSKIEVMVTDKLIMPFHEDGGAKESLVDNLTINLYDRSAQQRAETGIADTMKKMTLDKQAVAKALIAMVVEQFSETIAKELQQAPKLINKALEIAATGYALPRVDEIMSAADAITPNYVAGLVQRYFGS